MIFPTVEMEPLVTITPFSAESLMAIYSFGGGSSNFGNASTAYPTANKAFFYPFFLAKEIVVATLFTCNGSSVSGNVDVGIYDSAATRIVSAGSTAQSGTSQPQTFDIADTILAPGQYYLAIALSNTSGTFIRGAPNAASMLKAVGCAEMASAFPLPATATLATMTSTYIPCFGLSTRAVV